MVMMDNEPWVRDSKERALDAPTTPRDCSKGESYTFQTAGESDRNFN